MEGEMTPGIVNIKDGFHPNAEEPFARGMGVVLANKSIYMEYDCCAAREGCIPILTAAAGKNDKQDHCTAFTAVFLICLEL